MAKQNDLQTRQFPSEKRDSWLSRSWWVIAFVCLSSFVYLSAMHQKDLSYQELTGRLSDLEKQKAMALLQREELMLQIESQKDPAWVEMVLKRNLGLVPEGQVKVYFHKD